MTDLQPLFDYDALQPALREMVQEHTGEIRKLARRAAADIVEIGERLIEVKAGLGHGKFGPWLRKEFGWSPSAASKFMQVAEQFKSVNFTNLDIAPSALYALASGSTPDFIREEMVEMAAVTGQKVTHQAVKERLEAHYSDAPVAIPEPEPEVPEVPPVPELPEVPDAPEVPEPLKLPEVTPPIQEPPAPPEPAYAGEMSPKKKDAGKGKPASGYKPLQYDFEDVENARGELVKVPVLPDVPKHRELKQKNFDKAATRFETTASSGLTVLGRIADYTPEQLCELASSQEGLERGTETRIQQLEARMREALAVLEATRTALRGQQKTIDAAPLIEVLPPKKDDERVLELN